VIDGASTDGSREWLESQRARLGALVSEPDRGVYEAMNKGLTAAQGEWVLFLGADDRLANERVLEEARDRLQARTDGVVVGEAVYEDGRIYRLGAPLNPVARNFVHHQAAFYRRSLFAEHGKFDVSFAIMGDYDLNLRLWKKKVRFEPLDLRIAACGIGGLSDAGRRRGYAEEVRARHRHFPAWECWLWDGLSVVRFVRKKILRSFARK
jgi:putative colanic acid biosynthesis glycosyltransferase